MNPGEVIKKVDRLEEDIKAIALLGANRVLNTEKDINYQVELFRERTNVQVATQETNLTSYITYLNFAAEYHLALAWFHASPTLMAILSTLWGVLVAVWKGVTWVIDILHIKELLAVADVLSIIWPAFRERMDKIYAAVSKFSAQIGWGADGLAHLMQAAQTGINVLGGVMGRTYEENEVSWADKAILSLKIVSARSWQISTNPGAVLDTAFRVPQHETRGEITTWWDKTAAWITKASDTALNAITKVNKTVDDLQDLRNNMPAFVRDNIPYSIWKGLNWLDNQIESNILPAVSRLNHLVTELNGVLDAHRARAEELAARLALPGDLLLGIDKLSAAQLAIQEEKLDDATSRKYEKDTDEYEVEDAPIMAEFKKVADAISLPVTPLSFYKIEDRPPGPIPSWAVGTYTTWFVGDY